jgi:hypothetical protein
MVKAMAGWWRRETILPSGRPAWRFILSVMARHVRAIHGLPACAGNDDWRGEAKTQETGFPVKQ